MKVLREEVRFIQGVTSSTHLRGVLHKVRQDSERIFEKASKKVKIKVQIHLTKTDSEEGLGEDCARLGLERSRFAENESDVLGRVKGDIGVNLVVGSSGGVEVVGDCLLRNVEEPSGGEPKDGLEYGVIAEEEGENLVAVVAKGEVAKSYSKNSAEAEDNDDVTARSRRARRSTRRSSTRPTMTTAMSRRARRSTRRRSTRPMMTTVMSRRARRSTRRSSTRSTMTMVMSRRARRSTRRSSTRPTMTMVRPRRARSMRVSQERKGQVGTVVVDCVYQLRIAGF